jgi:acyl dehydratase
MPFDCERVGTRSGAHTHRVDARWTMAFAAAIGDSSPAYFDTAAAPVPAHPLFPVCIEWPAILDSRAPPGGSTLTPGEAALGVHASHDLHIGRPIVAGDVLTTTAHLVAVEARRPGAYQVTRLDTLDARGTLVARTYQGGILRGVALAGTARNIEEPPPPPALAAAPATAGSRRIDIPVHAGLAHTYSECARIWNPIHTDRAAALAAGLPDIILHGTATLALCVSALVRDVLGGASGRVTRIGCRFSGMVTMPSTLALDVVREEAGGIAFDVRTRSGERVISGGFLLYA